MPAGPDRHADLKASDVPTAHRSFRMENKEGALSAMDEVRPEAERRRVEFDRAAHEPSDGSVEGR